MCIAFVYTPIYMPDAEIEKNKLVYICTSIIGLHRRSSRRGRKLKFTFQLLRKNISISCMVEKKSRKVKIAMYTLNGSFFCAFAILELK